MRKLIYLAAGAFLLAGPLSAGDRFVASKAGGAKVKSPGKVVISNDHNSIHAFSFDGNIKTALLSLRSLRGSALRSQPFGSVIFDGNAAVSASVPAHLAVVIQEASRQYGVDPRLVTAVVRRESAFNSSAVSRVGAQGLMQLMPATAKYLGITDSFDIRQNVFAGTKYLRKLLDTFNGDLNLALAAYNAGPGAVARYKGIPPYRETQNYVAAIRADYERSLR